MNREKKLLINTIIVAIGKICTQFVSFFLLPLYTTYLSTSEYGLVDLINTIVFLLIPVIYFQIEQASFRFLIDERENIDSQKKIISTSFIFIIIETIIFSFVFFIFSLFIKNKFKYLLYILVIVSAISSYLLQLARGFGKNISYSIGSLVSGVSTIILNVYLIAGLKLGAYGMLIASIIGNILCCIYLIINMKIYKYISTSMYDSKFLKKMFKYCIPLIPNQLSWWIVTVSDRGIISFFIDIGANGIYSAANKFSNICISFFNIFNLTWSESASVHINDNDSSEFFTKIFDETIKLFTCLCLGIICFMPFVFHIFIPNPEYYNSYYQIPILMLSTIFSIIVSLYGSVYVALKKTKEIAKTSFYAAFINIVINIIFIKIIGIYAASISTLVAYLSMCIYRYFDVKKYVNIKLNSKFIISSIIFSIFILVAYYYNIEQILYINIIVIMIFSVYFNIHFIKKIPVILKIKK